MDLGRKIEEIRKKPEHIRIRYVWTFVAVSMLFIIIIWIFSLSESFKKIKPLEGQTFPDLKQNLEDLKAFDEINPSINDMLKNTQDASSEGIQNNQSEGVQENQEPTGNETEKIENNTDPNLTPQNPNINEGQPEKILPEE